MVKEKCGKASVESFHSGFLVPEWIITIGQAPSENYPWESQSSQPPTFQNFSIGLIDFELEWIGVDYCHKFIKKRKEEWLMILK